MTLVPYCYLFSSVVMNRIVKFDLCVCFGFSSHSRIWWPLPVKGFRSWPMLSTYGHRVVRGFFCVPHLMSAGHPFIMVISDYCRAFGSEAVTTSVNDLDLSRLAFEHPNLRLRGKRSNLLRHRRCFDEFSKTFETILTNSTCCIWRKKETCIANPLFLLWVFVCENLLSVFTFGN